MEKKTLYVAQKITAWKNLEIVSEQTGKIGVIAPVGSLGFMEVFATKIGCELKHPGVKSIPIEIPMDKFERLMK